MTTIVWDGEVLASDSRETSNGSLITDSVHKLTLCDPSKHFYDGVGVVAFGCSGTAGSARLLLALLGGPDGITALTPIGLSIELTVLLITEDGQGHWLFTDDTLGVILGEPVGREAIGSGSPFARSALLLGMDSVEAVEHAKKLDTATGGNVQIYRFSNNK